MNFTSTAAIVMRELVDQTPGGQGEDFGKSSPVGLVLLIVFAIAIAFLVRSMSKHLKRLPSTFDEEKAAAAAPARVEAAAARAERESTGSGEAPAEDGAPGAGDGSGKGSASEPDRE